uniref:DNA ligase n=1 Tax=Petromyzon marinus TaxID=7757 RepID=A0AAJ7X1M5_PETMA|nr:DNA ligase 3 [Petromyzon marinus]XP_032818002.1 DNA ligase 3 [Petromyzon marinus]XP_032818003.1 DNA ligase 3 [Petromyzon marinus]
MPLASFWTTTVSPPLLLLLLGRWAVGRARCTALPPLLSRTGSQRLTWPLKSTRSVFLLQRGPVSFLLRRDPPLLASAIAAMAEQRYCVDYARLGTAGCKKCKEKIAKGLVRIGKIVANPFGDGGGEMKEWHHVRCIFERLERSRPSTRRIEDLSDLEGYERLLDPERELINGCIEDLIMKRGASPRKPAGQTKPALASPFRMEVSSGPSMTGPRKFSGFSATPTTTITAAAAAVPSRPSGTAAYDPSHKDCLFREFRKLCAMIAEQPSYNSKTQIVHDFLRKGTSGDGFRGDVYLTVKLLLPGVVKSVYNIKDKQIVKLFSSVFNCSLDDMVRDLEKGDVSETIRVFFEASSNFTPTAKSTLTMQEVEGFLGRLALLTKEEEQQGELQDIARRCTSNDLKCIIRLIKHDLKMNAGAKHILDGLDPNAYDAFKASRNLEDVVDRVLQNWQDGSRKALSVTASLMTPVQPMLAEACKSVAYAMKKCPNGMYAEIKYDGERVQVHKNGDSFQYFSRSLKPVLPHKVAHFRDYIPKAFPGGTSMILDAEVLLIDTSTSKPLPFGTLGVHKKAAFQDANVCLFVFDCIYFNGESLMDRSIKDRRKFLHDNMVEIPNHILFSEMKHVTRASDLAEMISRVIKEGLEGLVLKDVLGIYEPGKRHWLKVKKDYLNQGAMADTADLAVLGAYYGHGSNGGIMSIFLMGCYDENSGRWCTVTKCSSGYDDATLNRLQKELEMVKISKSASKIPDWLKINKTYFPDFVIRDPKKAPVWEITGAEFSKAEAHSADGISIRFPRCTRMRDDKDWRSATTLQQLKELFKKSKENSDVMDLLGSTVKNDSESAPATPGGSTNGSGSSSPKQGPSTTTTTSSSSKAKASHKASRGASASRKPKQPSRADTKPVLAPALALAPAVIPPVMPPAPVKRKRSAEAQEETLLNIFTGVRLHLPASAEGYDRARRYFFAYDGDLVPDHDMDSATHAVAAAAAPADSGGPPAALPPKAQRVSVDWIWQCVKRRRLVPPC